MKIFLTLVLLLTFETLSAQTPETDNDQAATASAEAAQAEPVMAVIKIHTKKLYVYDDEFEEIDEIKASAVKKDFSDLSFGEETVNGLQILAIYEQEGLVSVQLSEFDDPVWIETMSVEIWPGNRLDCPEITVGQSEIEQSGMTMGFGDHCKQPE